MRARPYITLVTIVAAISAARCGDKRQGHLEQFLQPGQKQQQQPLPLEAASLGEDEKVADEVNQLPFLTVARLLGAHTYEANVFFSFTSPKGWVSLQEKDRIVYARSGDFRVEVENDAGHGYTGIFSGGRFYLKNRYQPYHERSILESQHIERLEQAHGSWAAIYRLYRGRLGFRKKKLGRYHGRDAFEYAVLLTGKKPRLGGTPEPPKVPEGVTKYVYEIEPTPSYTDRWRDRADPAEASGTVWVDADTGVILGVNFKGKLKIPAQKDRPEMVLTVKAEISRDGFGNPITIPPPDANQVEPIPERISVDTHPIDFFFGKGFTATRGAAAGVARSDKVEN